MDKIIHKELGFQLLGLTKPPPLAPSSPYGMYPPLHNIYPSIQCEPTPLQYMYPSFQREPPPLQNIY
jgi:hypothetical protein